MNRRRIVLALLVALLFGYVVVRGAQRGNDFKYPYGAAQAYWRTGRLHVHAQPRYPVSFHVLLSPLASMRIGRAATVWAALSFGAIAALPGLLGRLAGRAPREQLLAWAVVAPCFVDALILGQSDPINLFLVASALVAARQGWVASGVGLIGLAGMIKFLPVIHWATVVSQTRSWRVWAAMVLSAALALGLLVLAVGWDSAWSALVAQGNWIANAEKPWHLVARGSDLRANNESLAIVLARTFGNLGQAPPAHTLSLGRLPLRVVWAGWGAILACLAVAWLACARASRRVPPDRAWLGMFALSSIIMLASAPICWHHYFLWLLPANLYLADRRRLLRGALAISAAGTIIPLARGIGLHTLLALGLFVVVAHDLLRRARVAVPSPGTDRRRLVISAARPVLRPSSPRPAQPSFPVPTRPFSPVPARSSSPSPSAQESRRSRPTACEG